MSDSSRLVFGVIPESAWGTTPASARENVRITGESLGQSMNTTTSNEINATAQNADVIRTAIEASGNIDFELSYGNLDTLMTGVMRNDWSTAVNISADTSIAAVNSTNRYTSGSTDFTTKNISVGQWIKVSGFSNANNNGYKRVSAVAAGYIQVEVMGAALADESATPAITIKGSRIYNGTTAKSFTLEKQMTDITQFMSFTGMRVGTFDLNIQPGSIITGSMGFQGKQGARGTSTVGTGSAVAAPTNSIMNAVDNVSLIKENDVATTLKLTQLSFSLNNALRPQPVIGSLPNSGIGSGTVEVTGTIAAYFDSTAAALYDKYLADTPTSLAFLLSDAAGNAYMVEMKQLKLTDAQIVAGGKDQDILFNANLTAYMDPTYATTLEFNRFAA